MFNDALKIQLIAKGIIREDEWEILKKDIRYDFMKDNAFAELKDTELLNNRLQALQMIEPYIGKFYSVDWVKKHVLRMSEDQLEDIQKEIDKEDDYQVSSAQQQGSAQGVQQVATQKELDKAGYGQEDQPPAKK